MRDCIEGEPQGWIRTKLGEILPYGKCEKADPNDMPESSWLLELEDIERDTSKVIQRFKVGDRKPKSTKNRFEAGDVLYGKLRPYLNKIIVADKPGFCTTEIIPITPPKTVEGSFLYFWMRGEEFRTHVDRACYGVNMPRLGTKDGLAAPFLLPPLNEQRRIVAKVEELTARSRAAKEALDAIPPLLERFRQSVLAAAFRGDLTKRWREQNPDVEPASVLLERIRQERRQRWEEDYLAQQKAKGKTPKDDKWKAKYQEPEPVDTTDLPELPEGWCWASTSELGQVQLGRQRSPKNHTGSNMVPYLRAANVTWGGLSFEDVKTMHFEPDEVERFKLRAGDILLGEASGSQFEVGKSGVWREELYNCCFQNTLIRVRPIFPEMADYLQRHYFRNANNGDFGRASKGTGIHHIGAQKLETWPVALPPLSEQSELVNSLDRMLSNMTNLASLLERTKDRRASLEQSILAKAFRGELVPQDPNDEPASVLLERIRAEREATSAGQSGKKRKARK